MFNRKKTNFTKQSKALISVNTEIVSSDDDDKNEFEVSS